MSPSSGSLLAVVNLTWHSFVKQVLGITPLTLSLRREGEEGEGERPLAGM